MPQVGVTETDKIISINIPAPYELTGEQRELISTEKNQYLASKGHGHNDVIYLMGEGNGFVIANLIIHPSHIAEKKKQILLLVEGLSHSLPMLSSFIELDEWLSNTEAMTDSQAKAEVIKYPLIITRTKYPYLNEKGLKVMTEKYSTLTGNDPSEDLIEEFKEAIVTEKVMS